MSTGAISGIALNMASCTLTCGFYAGSWYDMTHTSSNTFTNYYPPGGATFTKPGIVIVNGGGAVMAVWQALTANNIAISNEFGISVNFWSNCAIGWIIPYHFMDIFNGVGTRVF